MVIEIREATSADIESCGRIMHTAFKAINERHNFENTDFPNVQVGCEAAEFFIRNPRYFGVVAELDHRIVGSNFLDERNEIRGVTTLSVDPRVQAKGIGRALMQAVLERCHDARGVRLLQHAFNTGSMGLYSSLGFDAKEPIALMKGQPHGEPPPTISVRRMQNEDLAECGNLCERIHGFERVNELRDALQVFKPFVALRDGKIVAYASAADAWPQNHGIAETEEDMRALILGIAAAVGSPILFLLPITQAPLLRWCLDQGLRILKPMTLMTTGEYQAPRGSYFTSVVY